MTRRFKLSFIQIITFSFFAVIMTGAIILTLPISSKSGEFTNFVDALFTATSATCVTGLVVVDTYTHWSIFGQFIVLALIQIGGLGLMTIITMISYSLRNKFSLRNRNFISDFANVDSNVNMATLLKFIFIGTGICELTGAIVLSTRFVPQFGWSNGLFKSVFHSVSAFCNAGIDLMGEISPFSSFTTYANDWVVNITIMSLIIIGGLGFFVLQDVLTTRKWKRFSLHTKVVISMTTFLILFGAIAIFIYEFNNPLTIGEKSIPQKILASFFQSVTPRTAGFNTLDLPSMKNGSHLVMVGLMFIGGAPASTAGGVKVTTMAILIFSVIAGIRDQDDINGFKRRFQNQTIYKAIAVFIIYLGVVCIGVLTMCYFEDFSMGEILFETVSAIGTVGLSLGITTKLSVASKIILTIIIYLGRVGIISLILSLLFKKSKVIKGIKYPEGKIML